MNQYPCSECGNVFYSISAISLHLCNKNQREEIDNRTFYHPKDCPRCEKKMYSYLSEKTKTIQSICYACGYYWSNSSVYEPNCEMFENMINRNPFLLHEIIKQPKIHW